MLRTTSLKLLNVIAVLAFASGCGVQAKTYVMTKDRVGIDYQGGNAGYIMGKPQFVESDKKTRKVYILELTKPISENSVKKIQEETVSQADTAVEQVPAYQQNPRPLVIAPSTSVPVISYTEPLVPDDASAPEPVAGGISYTVVKDDTLQKISKKFYDSYGKWMKIYDANKDKIKNPNFVKPGTVLTIPPAEQ